MATLSEQAKLDVAAAYAAASRSNDGTALAALAAPGALTWHNFDDKEVSIEHTVRALGWVHKTVPDASWSDVSLKTTADGFVWQSILTGTAPGGPLRAYSCLIVTLNDDGQVTRAEEYLDTAQTAVLRG